MKKIILSILMLMPLMAMAQGNWEIPQSAQVENAKAKKQKANKKKEKADDSRYLRGAVPEVDGKVVYAFDVAMPGLSAQQVYDKAYAQLEMLTKDEHQTGNSIIALVNKEEHNIIANYEEWLVFSDKIFQLDRTQMGYIIIAKCSNGNCRFEIERINYKYELQRRPEYYKAEEIITDDMCVSKDGTKLKRGYLKFRRKTVDRMAEIQKTLTAGMKSGL